MRVAFNGLGLMGEPMARNLLRAGHELAVWNRSPGKAAALVAAGARLAATPREAAENAEVVFAMVSDDEASRSVWLGEDGALSGAAAGAVLVECSTLSLEWVRELLRLARERGLDLLDSPVTGSTDAAAAGSLGLLVGGEPGTLVRARPALEAVSGRITHLGPSGSGAAMKLVNNLNVAVQALALAESLAFAERAGLPRDTVIELLSTGSVASPIVKGKGPLMASRDYSVRFALKWMHKDLVYALAAANEHGSAMPVVAAARETYRLARNRGHGDEDFAAVIELLRD